MFMDSQILQEVMISSRPLTEQDHEILELAVDRLDDLANSGIDSLIDFAIENLDAIEARIDESILIKSLKFFENVPIREL